MTVRIERTFEFDAPPEEVWAFIADPAKRAEAISVVDDYEVHEDGSAVWHVKLPIPGIRATVSVKTREVEKVPPERVKFVGKSRALRVTGVHIVERTATGAKLHNQFVVDGRLPGVERFFKSNLDAELENLAEALRAELGQTA